VQQVIKEIDIPTWIGSLPNDFGEAKAGSLKAYQWRILWTIHIPLALVSLWHQDSPDCQQGIDQSMDSLLNNVMHLAAAMTVVYKRTTSKARADLYREHYSSYVRGVTELFPGFSKPSFHTAFHIYDFLVSLGPVHCWWCFPYERLIGRLQRMHHNHKRGQQTCSYCLACAATHKTARSAGKDDSRLLVETMDPATMARPL
jgi:hypothetical protein